MPASPVWRLLAACALLVSLSTVLPSIPLPAPASVVAGDDDGGGDDGDNAEDEANDDGDDNEGKDKKDKKDKEKKDKDNKGKGNDDDDVGTVAGYTMNVSCETNREAASTQCTFTPQSPEGGKKVNHAVVPASLVCTDVREGDADYVENDPQANVEGYRFEGQGSFSITFEGTVQTEGRATYWVKAASEVYPATGPGLACPAVESDALAVSTPPPATPPPTTGDVVVATYTCQGVTPDTMESFDWFGRCEPAAAGQRYVLAPEPDKTGDLVAAETGADGTATFGELQPGTYDLDDPDRNWCHAESDNVDAEGSVVVETGAETTVWLFYCMGE